MASSDPDHQKPDSRRKILDAAAEEFARFGLKGVRMRAIVARSGMNERMIYHHFLSKDGLYRAVLADQWSAPMSLPDNLRGSPKEQFVGLLRLVIARLSARPHFFALAMHESLNGWQSVPQAALGEGPAVLRARFEAAQQAGELRADCPFEVVYVAAIGAMVAGRTILDRFSDLRADKVRAQALTDDVLALIVRGAEP
jgi:AcrR family transcriptional regulator